MGTMAGVYTRFSLFFLLVTFFRLIIELTMARSIAQILLHTFEGGGGQNHYLGQNKRVRCSKIIMKFKNL